MLHHGEVAGQVGRGTTTSSSGITCLEGNWAREKSKGPQRAILESVQEVQAAHDEKPWNPSV